MTDEAVISAADRRYLTVAIRADASSRIGTGHVLRCLGLADELARRGHRVIFITVEAAGHLMEMVRARGYECVALAAAADAREDGSLTMGVISRLGAAVDWLIVDHYGLDSEWETLVRPSVRRLLVLDDLADRQHEADALLDPVHSDESAYRGLVPARTRLLLGPQYVLLRREFFSRRQTPRVIGPVHRILITFGGNDPLNLTGLVLRALAAPDFAALRLDVTLGTSNMRLEEVRRQANSLPNVTVYVQHPKLSELMEVADLCVGAGGTTTWERCYLGLPTLIAILADNQRDFAAYCNRIGVARLIGEGENLRVEDIRSAVLSAMEDEAWRAACSVTGQALVDGQGIARVIDVLES